MYRLTITGKTLFWFFSVLMGLPLLAQTQHFQFIPIKEPGIEQMQLAGKLGNHFFLMSTDNTPDLQVYVYDTVTRKGTIHTFDFPKPLSAVQMGENTIRFIATSRSGDQISAHLLELDMTGNPVRRQETILPGARMPLRVQSSGNRQYVLFYQLIKKTTDSSLIRGVLLDADWKQRKQLLYSFRRNAEQDAEPETFLDNQGNTHVLVYDKYANYRLSSDLAVNSIPLHEELIISETFTFEKVKLKTMRVFQNNECNCLQAEGMYVDGMSKNNKGIYSIAFPPGRKNELAPRFIPFHNEMIRYFRKGFSATDETVQASLQLQDILYTDSGSVAVLKLAAGIPSPVQKIRPEDDPSVRALGNTLATARASDIVASAASATTTAPRMRTSTVADKFVNAAPLGGGLPPKPSALASKATGRNAPKLIFIKLDKEQGFAWYAARSLDVFHLTEESFNRQLLASDGYQEVQLLLYQADALEEPYPVLITMRKGDQAVQKFPFKQLRFSPLQLMAPGQYASLYQNKETAEGGILLVHSKESFL
jgi:hypothetical protein